LRDDKVSTGAADDGLASTVGRVLAILTPLERRHLLLLSVPVVVAAVLEAAGVASIIPFLGLLSDPQALEKSEWLRRAYDVVGVASRERFFFVVGLAVLVMMTVSNVTQALTTYALLRFSWMRNHTLSVRLLDAYLRRPYTFFVENNSADLAKNLLTEVQQVVTGIIVQGLQLCARAVVIVLVAGSLLFVDPFMAIGVTTAFGGLYGAIYMVSRRRLSLIGQQRLDANAARFKVASEILSGIKELKLLGLERTLLRSYAAPSEVFADRMARNAIMGAVPRYALETVAFGGALVIVLYLLWGGRALEESLPVLGLYVFAAYRLLPAVQVVFNGVTTIRFNLASFEELARGMENALGDEGGLDAENVVEPLPFRATLALKDVHYRYPRGEKDAVQGVDLTLRRGEWVALVGPTGSGKSTLVDLLLGLLAPTSGVISVDGVPLADLRRWQRNVGYVPQQIFLTDDTVRRNIAFGVPVDEIDDARVVEAARVAQIHDFIAGELPGGYESVVGERGVRLSGGQRQRLGIARSLYRQPELLVLDEATSALDGATEAAFFQALRDTHKDRTVISIAHRLSTTKTFDRVILVERGVIVAEGAPEQAIDGRGAFSILHRGAAA
jgi:ATP-binding cassette subfamily C protein